MWRRELQIAWQASAPATRREGCVRPILANQPLVAVVAQFQYSGSPPELRPASSSSTSTPGTAVTQATSSFESNSRPNSRSYWKFGPAPVARIFISNAEAPHHPAPTFSPEST